MSTTAGGFPLMAQTQSSRYLTYNELAWALNVLQAGVISRAETAPPGSPAVGDAYIPAATATGAWVGLEDKIVFWFGGVWNVLEPEIVQGRGIYVQDEDLSVRWEPLGSPPAYVATSGVESVNTLSGPVSLNGGYIGVKGDDIASASTVDLAAATGDWVDVTGTTTITALGTVTAGVERLVRFTGALTLTHNGTSLILPTGANITTTAGDFARFRSLGSGNWVCVAYQRASGQALAGATGAAGRHAIWIAAGSITPSATGGCAALATIASAANQPDIQTLDFDATTQEYAQFSIRMPKSWDEGTVTFAPVWSHAATTTNFGVVWDLQAVAVSNDDAIAVAFGTAQTSTDTGGTTNDVYIGPESSAITVSGTPAAEDVVFFRLSRVTGNGSDNMEIDARLHGITVYITTDASNDA